MHAFVITTNARINFGRRGEKKKFFFRASPILSRQELIIACPQDNRPLKGDDSYCPGCVNTRAHTRNTG